MTGRRLFEGAALAAALILSVVRAPSAAEKIRIAGDPCSVPLITRLADAYAERDRDFFAEVSTYNCTLGVFKAADGEFDMGVSTQNGLGQNLPHGATNRVIAKSPIVLIVNRTNPVDNITYEQLKGIYSGEIRNWKDAGGSDIEIKNVMLAPCVRHTISKQVVPYSEDLNLLKPAQKVNPVTYTNKLVSEDPGAMGEQIYGYESDAVKVLKVDGLLPDEGTLPHRYTFYQDFNIVTPGEPVGKVKEFIEFAYSAEGRKIIQEMKHIAGE